MRCRSATSSARLRSCKTVERCSPRPALLSRSPPPVQWSAYISLQDPNFGASARLFLNRGWLRPSLQRRTTRGSPGNPRVFEGSDMKNERSWAWRIAGGFAATSLLLGGCSAVIGDGPDGPGGPDDPNNPGT